MYFSRQRWRAGASLLYVERVYTRACICTYTQRLGEGSLLSVHGEAEEPQVARV